MGCRSALAIRTENGCPRRFGKLALRPGIQQRVFALGMGTQRLDEGLGHVGPQAVQLRRDTQLSQESAQRCVFCFEGDCFVGVDG